MAMEIVTGAFVNAAISFIRILLSATTLALMLPLIIYFLAITESKFDASASSRQSFESLVTRAVEVCRRQSIHFQVIRNFPRMVSIFGLVIAVAQDQGRGRIENALCPCFAPLSLRLGSACSPVLLCHTSCSLHASIPLSPGGRRGPQEPKRQEGDPDQANADRQALEDSSNLHETRILGKADGCQYKGCQHTKARQQ